MSRCRQPHIPAGSCIASSRLRQPRSPAGSCTALSRCRQPHIPAVSCTAQKPSRRWAHCLGNHWRPSEHRLATGNRHSTARWGPNWSRVSRSRRRRSDRRPGWNRSRPDRNPSEHRSSTNRSCIPRLRRVRRGIRHRVRSTRQGMHRSGTHPANSRPRAHLPDAVRNCQSWGSLSFVFAHRNSWKALAKPLVANENGAARIGLPHQREPWPRGSREPRVPGRRSRTASCRPSRPPLRVLPSWQPRCPRNRTRWRRRGPSSCPRGP